MNGDSEQLPLLTRYYREYLDSQDIPKFRELVTARYTQATMERLGGHDSPQVRRSAILGLGMLGDYSSNATLGRALMDDDRTVRMIAENAIRDVWQRCGTLEQQGSLAKVIQFNQARRYREAEEQASELIELFPWLAEAWEQRASARFSLGEYAASIRDGHQALELNPYHFVAAARMGQAYLELGNHLSALEAFRRALRLNRDLEGVRTQVARLTRLIEGH